jgi:hypothetical protein
MGTPSAHGQRNKGHKPGRHSARGTREKHKEASEANFEKNRKSIMVSAARPPAAEKNLTMARWSKAKRFSATFT